MESGTSSPRLLRLIAVLALPLMLLAALLPTPGASAGVVAVPGDSTVTYQVYVCPTDYAGEDYLTDCVAGESSFTVTLYGNGGEIDRIGDTDDQGFVTFFDLPLGTSTATLGVPGDFAHFYYACFDTSSGGEIYTYDGTGNQITEKTSGFTGSSSLCRWYITPESQGGPEPSAGPIVPDSFALFQVYVCPVAYSGQEYLTDCSPTVDPIGLLLSPTLPFDPDDFVAAETSVDGKAGFGPLLAGDYSAVVDVSAEFADFYVACFDATSGAEVYLFDGDTNTVSFDLASESVVSCRWYIIPENLSGESASPSASAVPSVAPSVTPSATPQASASPGGVIGLPNTGAGSSIDGNAAPAIALIVLAVVAFSAAAIATRRFDTTR